MDFCKTEKISIFVLIIKAISEKKWNDEISVLFTNRNDFLEVILDVMSRLCRVF